MSYSTKIPPLFVAITLATLLTNGETYGASGNGLIYRWNVSHTANTRNRGGSADLRLSLSPVDHDLWCREFSLNHPKGALSR
jgi:hypothetical protein